MFRDVAQKVPAGLTEVIQGSPVETNGGAGVKDTFEVCAKGAADAYAWPAIY